MRVVCCVGVLILITTGTQAQATSTPRWRSLYEFTARTADELSLHPGDLVSDAQPPSGDPSPGWRWGTSRGKFGWFPESYVEDYTLASTKTFPEAVETYETKTQLEGIAEVPEAEISNDLGGAMPTVEGGDWYLAVYPFTSSEAGDLTFEAGERIHVLRRYGDWWCGRIGNRIGLFPSSYVTRDTTISTEVAAIPEVSEVQENDPELSASQAQQPVQKMTQSQSEAAQDNVPQVIALYPYTAQNADELSFDKDDIISVTDRSQDPAWWQGKLRGMVGLFPTNYVAQLVK